MNKEVIDLAPIGIGAPTDIDRVVGSRNGLVCVLSKEKDSIFWNPTTREMMKLPQLERPHDRWHIVKPVFVFLCDLTSDSIMGRLYSSDTNSWKTIEVPEINLCLGYGQYVSGKFHWHTEPEPEPLETMRRHEIVSFDSESGMFGMIPGPIDLSCCFSLAVVGECLGLEIEHNIYEPTLSCIDVWVMKQYGLRESWVKLAAVDLMQLQRQPQPPLIGGPNGKLLLFSAFDFFVYWPKDDVFDSPPELTISTKIRICTYKA